MKSLILSVYDSCVNCLGSRSDEWDFFSLCLTNLDIPQFKFTVISLPTTFSLPTNYNDITALVHIIFFRFTKLNKSVCGHIYGNGLSSKLVGFYSTQKVEVTEASAHSVFILCYRMEVVKLVLAVFFLWAQMC